MSLSILNVGEGDTKISFDPAKPDELERSKVIIEDMMRRGFAIFVECGEKDGKPIYYRAERFDPETCEYIVIGLPDDLVPRDAVAPPEKRRPGRPRKNETRLPASTTPAKAVARSAGG